jgi:hypothetical protein
VWSSGASYLGIQVGNDAEMSPREAIGNVPTALTVPDGAITQAQAPSLIKSGNGDNYEIYVGHAEISSTNDTNEAYIPFGRTFDEVLAFLPINHNVYSHYGHVIGVRSLTGSGGWVRFSDPADNYTYRIKYIVVGK